MKGEIRMAIHKALKDLNLLDRFLFAEAMEDPVIMQTILEIILGKDILLKYPPQAEKEKRSSPPLPLHSHGCVGHGHGGHRL